MTTITKAKEEIEESQSQTKDKKPKKKGKEKKEGDVKDIYFLILYPRKQKEKSNEFTFSETDINFQNIYSDELEQENGTYFYKKVFKFNGKTKKKYSPEFEIGKDNYIVTFEVNESSFIYDVDLKKGNKILKNIAKEVIDQKIIDYHRKLDIFFEALKNSKEEGKKDDLYKETIELFEKKKSFSFLITLFIKTYKNKELCSLLIEKFKKMNNESKNMDRNKDLEDYIDIFKEISTEADNLIKNNGVEPVQFYGIILCYLNFYDQKNFMLIFQKLFKEKPKVLYEILLSYFSYFLKPIKQNLDFFIELFDYAVSNKTDFNIFENTINYINYIRDVETFISVMDKIKEKIIIEYVTSNKSFKPIKLKSNLELIKREKNKEVNTIILAIESIIKCSKDNKVLLVYFTSNFWIQILKDYNIPDDINIENCYKLREIFIKYNNLVNDLYKEDKDKNSEIKKDINKYFDRDEFAFILDKNIKKMLDNNKKKNKELSNSEMLGFVEGFNPYYKEDKYLYKRDTYIFDYINLDEKSGDGNKQFIETFKNLKFEIMFKDNLIEFLNKMISKIESISNFGLILELIDTKKIEEIEKETEKPDKKEKKEKTKLNDFYNQLKDKYDHVIKNEIESLVDEKLDEAVKIIAKFVDLLYIHENKNCDFIEKKINKLDKKISSLIYNELMRRCKGEDYKEMKEVIYKKFLNKLDNIKNIIDLIDSLEKDDKKKFLEELMKKCLFEKEEYYSNKENKKIVLLCELNKEGKLQITDEDNYYSDIEKVITQIRNDLEGDIEIKKLEEFLKNGKESVIKRLSLITLILKEYDIEELYNKLQKQIEQINKDINELSSIKNSLLIFHRKRYQTENSDIAIIIKEMQDKNLKNYNNEKTQAKIANLKKLNIVVKDVEKVKKLLLFRVLYDEALGSDQENRFKEASNKLEVIKKLFKKEDVSASEIYKENKDIFNKIKEMLSVNESKADIFIKQMVDYFEIKEKKELINQLSLIFKSKKYELDLKSIIYFFDSLNFQKDTNDDFKKKLDKKYEKLSEMDIVDLKNNLEELKTNKIYDYENTNTNKNFILFTSLYEKKEAIDFLSSKTNQDINALKKRIDPTNRTITIKNIQDTEECLNIFNEFKTMSNSKIFEKIKTLSEEQISKFEIFSKNYSSIIELDTNDDSSLNLYNQVYNYLQDATFIFRQDNEDFSYGEKGITNMEELIHLKNKIHIKPPKEEGEDLDDFQKKCYELIFFKDIISKLEVIYDYMKVLRTKGSSLPILITIRIKASQILYFLNKKKTIFENIRDFLFKAKTDCITQLDLVYKQKKYLRFLFGKLFRNIIKHLDGGYNVFDILRFILNKTDNNEEIKDGKAANPIKAEDYVQQYKIYNENSFDNISGYLTSLFENNDTSLQKHYKTMLMKDIDKYKGIYLHKCLNESMEEFILNIYWEKMGQLPIAQNVLISSKETSQEEMQAFFYRAILSDYNTLFVVEINDSFSDFQQNIMYTYIDTILTYKYEKYKEWEKKKNVDKAKTKDYLDSCIIFVYEENNKDDITFLNEMKRYEPEEIGYKMNKKDIECSIITENLENKEKENEKDKDDSNINSRSTLFSFENKLENIKVITSDICGLGKSNKIKKMIEKENKIYFHFPLGGILTKAVIYDKLSQLLKKIRKENEKNYRNVAVHLDLTESKEASILNEFFFSFLITKFYANNDNIIYIPKEIEIYVEIPNCFENYVSKFGILKAFNKENISLEKIPKLDLPKKLIDILKNMIEFDNTKEDVNGEIEKYIKSYIGIEKYSYHQLIIFIKLFISQYSKFTNKLTFKEGKKDETETYIKEFAECTKYFTSGGFAKLLMLKKYDKDYIDLLSENYDSDLKDTNFDNPLIFLSKEKKTFHQLIISSTEFQSSKDYLKKIKEILDLPNDIEKDEGNKKSLLSILDYKTDHYVITNDNFKKMFLLLYRIRADVPVIIMGETGCGKTALITKLNQILNNGEITVKIINIHPGITDEDICKDMRKIDKDAKENKNKEIWVFFDEINTCLSLSLLTEIFINRTYNGEQLSENIRLIGACNPYRKRKESTEKCGLSRDDDDDNELVYLVQPLPQSLLYYVFSFGSINEEDEKKYIFSIIEKLFTNDEQNLHETTRDAIFECHKFLRETFDTSVVSLREISRFTKCVEFFQYYFTVKNEYENKLNENQNGKKNNNESKEKLNKIKSIICSIYLCYYIRLIDEEKRTRFNSRLRNILLKLVNFGESDNEKKKATEKNENEGEKGGNLLEQIKYKQFKDELREENISQFSDLLKNEEEFLLDKIELPNGIGKNNLLKENTFLLFLAVITKIPLIIVGKPGTGKSLSAQLIYKSMRGIYSKDPFFRKFPKIIQTYFQGSESTLPEDVEKLFEIAGNKLQFYIKKGIEKEKLPISMILFDELGLAEKSKSNPLKVLHSKLEYAGKEEGVSFIGISNYSLDAAKVNRALNLSVPNLEDRVDQLIDTSKSIVKSISEDWSNKEDLSKNIIFEILPTAYYQYKNNLNFIRELTVLKQFYIKNKDSEKLKDLKLKQFSEIKNLKEFKNLLKKEKKIKVDFHGNRDLYNFIKGIAREIGRLNVLEDNKVVSIIEQYIERNFGGIDYEIDIDLDLKLTDIEEKIKKVNEMLKEFIVNNKNKKKEKKNEKEKNEKDKKDKKDKKERIKVTSVFLFKKIYNLVCDTENNYKIDNNRITIYDLNRCINDNINDINNRYLLLEIKQSLAQLIYQNIQIQNPDKKSEFYEGSPFVDDNNNEYRFKKVNDIQDDAKSDKLIILQNLNQIQPFLYDLYNMNYIIKDEKKFARICLDNFSEQLTPVNDLFRIIILVDRTFINEVDMAFLNRLEKMKITFDKLLDNDQFKLTRNIMDEINFKYYIGKYENQINYSLRDLLINCGKEEIEGLIYNFSIQNRNNNNKIGDNDIKEKIYNKISIMLPQEMICILPDNNYKIKNKYFEEKKYYNLDEYIKDKENKIYKISIIYAFNNIANSINGINNEMKFMVSSIKTEYQLGNIIEEIKKKNEDKKIGLTYNIVINFEQFNSNKIQFISNYIINNCKNDIYNYIFIIHIKRNFDSKSENRIYSIPNVNPLINQLFIDNLNSTEIKLKDLLDKNIKEIMDHNEKLMDLNKEFKRTLTSFVYKELNEKRNYTNTFINDNNQINEDNYIDEIQKYMDEEVSFKEKIIEKAKELINNDKEAEGDCKSLIDKIFNMKYIGKNTIDIISCLLDYIKEQIFSKYLKHIFEVLEDNNILTTLLEIKKNKNKNNTLNESIIEQLREYFLNLVTLEEKKFIPKFLFNYKIPGFFNFYNNLSNYINKNIITEYSNNEKKLREYFKPDSEKQKMEFHNKEENFLSSVYDAISEDKFIIDIINEIEKDEETEDLILQDYIFYYLVKYNNENSQNDIYNKVIKLLINLRFNEDKNEIIKNYKNDPTKLLLIKIIWIESNVNYILNIIKIFSFAIELFYDGDKLYERIEKIIYNESRNLKYITNEKRNPEHTREVNECYYIILASLCLSITSEDMKLTESYIFENNKEEIEINLYYNVLKEMTKILQDLDDDLLLYLNEMYIIDELKEVIELQKLKKIDIVKIEEIRKHLRDNALIIQNDQPDKIPNLIVNFQNIYDSLTSEEINKEEENNYYNKYYDTLRYIYMKEIKKISDINYRCKILEKLLQEKEIIKKSNDIFQILLKKYISLKTGDKEFKKNLSYISKTDDEIINLIENYLIDNNKKDNYFALSETLLYFFEKNSIIYLNNALYSEKEPILLEKEPLDIFKDCIKYLNENLKNPEKIKEKIKYITKLFCLGYIKTYCSTFIKMFDEPEPKFKEPEKIIQFINDNKLKKMIKLYIYKILFNQNQIEVFLNPNTIKKYKLEEYEGFTDFIQFLKEEQIHYGLERLDNNDYEIIYKEIEKCRKESFKKIIKKEESNEKFNIDNFYNASSNLILSYLKRKDFEKSEIYENFYKNVCKPLFENKNDEKSKLSNAIQFFFNPKKYEEIKKDFGINSVNIEAILYGYRYCLNELSEENEDGIYSNLYVTNNINYLGEKFYPGSDTKDEPYYELYSKIINHFNEKPNDGCYVCLCNKGFYHSVSSGFPGILEKNIKCPNCEKEIGAIYNESEVNKKLVIVKRDKYYRILKDKEEEDSLKRDKNKRDKLDEINYMTVKDFEEQYIQKLLKKEKGLPIIDKNYFKKDNKIVRKLSQISYRLLNYILYSHLFFARIFTKTKRFDNYLPKEMNWGETLNECWILLKNELSKRGINYIDIFMNITFKDLFNKLHDKELIEQYEDLIDFEKELEELIKEKIESVKKENEKIKKLMNEKNKDKNSSFYFLKETYESQNLKKDEKNDYPYYEYFYYCDYLDEKYISEKLSHMDENKYPILKKYLEYKNNNKDKIKDNYSLDNLNLFNTVLNLFSENYSHQITREYAEKKLLIDDEIYQNVENKKLIDDFIKFYNKLKINSTDNTDKIVDKNNKDSKNNKDKKDKKKSKDSKNSKENEVDSAFKLDDKKPLSDFLIDDDNKIGKTYKQIYKKFITKQNEEINPLLEIKVIYGVFNSNCTNKINVQQIKENEIFTFNVPKKFSFINVVFNSSYRKIIDNNNNYEIYNQYEINFDSIEETMTDLLLKNKKLLNEDIIMDFSYNNEVFNNEVTNLITSFKTNYNTSTISLDDKEILYLFIKEYENNTALYKDMINDFINLLQYLNELKKEDNDNNDISENSKINEVFEKLKDSLSEKFLLIFKEKNDLTVNKTSEIFEYFLKLIFKDVKNELKEYQIESEENELKDKKKKLDEYFNDESSLFKWEEFISAIRLFITLVLFREQDKENKIKSNRKNIVNYLKAPDLWDKKKYNDEKFIENLNRLKSINIQINQILDLVDIKEEDVSDVVEHIKSKKKNDEPEEKDDKKNDDDSDDDNDDDDDDDDDDDVRGGRE